MFKDSIITRSEKISSALALVLKAKLALNINAASTLPEQNAFPNKIAA